MIGFSAISGVFGVALTFFLFDPKAIPGMWHFRMISILFRHLVWHRNRVVSAISSRRPASPSTVFRSHQTRTYCSTVEIDLNVHKSNSTFYADLDLSRLELLMTLFKDAITPLSPRATLASEHAFSRRNRRRPLIAALGGVACLFRREIKPYQKYEVVTRVLTWDEKWLYLVSYFVKPGGAKGSQIAEDKIFASAISRYVFKKGRQTVTPAEVMRHSGLLSDHTWPSDVDITARQRDHPDLPCQIFPHHSTTLEKMVDSWTWLDVEAERQRGLSFARSFSGFEGLQGLSVKNS
ncbi:hypothetical protein PDE_01219 [Penicillium oxalicum 114-2]|uniref:Thioesterase domain-containing protein n=1 Tax=Penicillium oxalicum (strain 114-2 / CGMCC 5302) TaxID=933388 RepID=S8AKD3_PENO1|nr:hypothetical protein PDE_01219 [Penicillium oxalicum 114-2]